MTPINFLKIVCLWKHVFGFEPRFLQLPCTPASHSLARYPFKRSATSLKKRSHVYFTSTQLAKMCSKALFQVTSNKTHFKPHPFRKTDKLYCQNENQTNALFCTSKKVGLFQACKFSKQHQVGNVESSLIYKNDAKMQKCCETSLHTYREIKVTWSPSDQIILTNRCTAVSTSMKVNVDNIYDSWSFQEWASKLKKTVWMFCVLYFLLKWDVRHCAPYC